MFPSVSTHLAYYIMNLFGHFTLPSFGKSRSWPNFVSSSKKKIIQTNKLLLLLSNLLFTGFLTSLEMMSQFLVLLLFNALNLDSERCQMSKE